jgi:hypothetical protein
MFGSKKKDTSNAEKKSSFFDRSLAALKAAAKKSEPEMTPRTEHKKFQDIVSKVDKKPAA